MKTFKKDGLYIKPLKWLKIKKATISLKNNDEECFKHAALKGLFVGELQRRRGVKEKCFHGVN